MTPLTEPNPAADALFVKLYLQTGDALDSYIRCGHKAHGYEARTAAAWLLEQPNIQLALKTAETLKPKAPVDITRESIVSDLDAIHASAVADKDYTPAIAAKKLQASLLGLIQENVQITHKMDVSAMTDAQLEKLIAAKAKQIDGEFTVIPQGLGQLSAPK